MKIKYAAGLLAAITLAVGSTSSWAQPTNMTLYNFDTDEVTGIFGNWFGGYFQSVAWDSSNDASNNLNSGSMQLILNCTGSDQYVLWDGATPTYSPVDLGTWTNLSFDIRYDESSAIRTNTGDGNGSLGPGSLDFGYMRVGSRSPGFAQDWIQYFAISATNGAGLPNTNWIHINVDLQRVTQDFSDLSAGLVDIIIGMDGSAYGNSPLVGQQTLWFDNIQLSGAIPHPPPPTMALEKASPSALWLFGGSGLYGRSQVALQDTSATWIGGTFPVEYSFTILDNATSPGGLQTGIQFVGGGGDASYLDWGAANVLWLEIISGTGTNTTCVADVSWKTNYPGHNPPEQNTALMITNSVLAGMWKLTFLSDTNGTLTAPGNENVNVPFSINLADADAIAAFSPPVQVRFGHENFGNTANGGVPHYWANILATNTAGTSVYEDFTKKVTTQLDTNIWNLNTSDGVGVINLVPTNAPYWVTWTTPDAGFSLINGTSLTGSAGNWNALTNVTPISQGGIRWALIPSESLPAGSESYYALIKRSFEQLQVLFPGETNAPGTPTGKVGTPDPLSLSGGGFSGVVINAVDSTYHIVNVSGDMIALGCSDASVILPSLPAALVNGAVTQQVFFSATGSFTLTATNITDLNIPPATSSSITVVP